MKKDWWPTKELYDPGLTKEDWLSIINDREMCQEKWLHILARFYEYGGEGACSAIEDYYDEQPKSYNMYMQFFGKKLISAGKCQMMSGIDDRNRYWPVPFIGRDAEKSEPGVFVWKLRAELKAALTEFDVVSWDQDYLLRELVNRYKTLIEKTNYTEFIDEEIYKWQYITDNTNASPLEIITYLIKNNMNIYDRVRDLDDVCFDITKEQYERLLTSYKTKKLKYMNDDESIADICELFIEYYGYEELSAGEKLVVSYPIEITNGLSFDTLPPTKNDENGSDRYYTGSFSGETPQLFISSDNQFKLSDGTVAYYDDKRNVYICHVSWLGREVEVMIYADAETIEGSKDSVKKAFDDFMKNKNDYLKMCQNDVVDKLLPYIKANNTVENRVSDLEISEEDFYADYSLSDVYIIACEYMNEIQITFKSDNSKDEISVHRDLESDCIIDFYDGINVFYSDDMGL